MKPWNLIVFITLLTMPFFTNAQDELEVGAEAPALTVTTHTGGELDLAEDCLDKAMGKDKEYFENYEGRLIPADGVKGRYVRLYSRGSTYTALNRYTEVEVFGIPQ